MKYLIPGVILIILTGGCVQSLGPSDVNAQKGLTVWGAVKDNAGNYIPETRIKFHCYYCNEITITQTSGDGWYWIYAGDHLNHEAVIEAEKEGYLSNGIQIYNLNPIPSRIDFTLIPLP